MQGTKLEMVLRVSLYYLFIMFLYREAFKLKSGTGTRSWGKMMWWREGIVLVSKPYGSGG